MKKSKILLVDDVPANLYSLEHILADTDREIFCASSGNEALKLTLKHDFALILSDVQMPEMDGYEMVSILRMNPKTKLIPVIYVTAISKDYKYVMKGYSEGAVDYLFKPLDPDIVRAKTEIFVALDQQKMVMEVQNKELESLNDQKNRFLGMAAHDLRNPISVISHFSEMLLDEIEGKVDDESYKHLEAVKGSANLMEDLVNELLDVAKIESGKLEVTPQSQDLIPLLKDIVGVNKIFSERKQIEVDLKVDLESLIVDVDGGKLTHVLNNLISNGVKYSKPKTKVSVELTVASDAYEISVRDEGQGIPKSELPKLFEPFQVTSVKSTGGEKSTGLGLTIVSKILEAHEGEIKVESEVGVGSVFKVKLPRAIKGAIKVVQTDESVKTEEGDLSNVELKNVLLVEDDLIVQMLSKSIFKPYNVDLRMVATIEDAKKIVDEGKVDLLFSDLNLVGESGLDLTRALREAGVKIPIYGLSAKVDDERVKECKECGMNDLFEKPLSKLALEDILKSL